MEIRSGNFTDVMGEAFPTQKDLTDRLDEASRKYYRGEESGLTDTDFDMMMKELQSMESKSGFVFPNSPTQRVGSDLRKEFGKVPHPAGFPMLTIENSYDDHGIVDFVNSMSSRYGCKTFNASLKYDGISCELHYAHGCLFSASTRGDRLIGDDITENVRTVRDVPMTLNLGDSAFGGGTLYVRGEILLPRTRLAEINAERIAAGEKPFANCRNACSGSVKQLDSRVTARRGLIFRAWDILSMSEDTAIPQTKKMEVLKALGFKYEEGSLGFRFDITESDFLQRIRKLYEFSKTLDYDCDGIVIKVDDPAIQWRIGTKDHRAIEWGIARKWNEEKEVRTRILGVGFQVGVQGAVTPVARLEPVGCDGVTISNATLNNEDFIATHDIHIGDELRIVRSGGVIPYVVGNCTAEERKASGAASVEPRVAFPAACPVCGRPLVKDGSIWRCPNKYGCAPQVEGRIEQWCGKDAMDINGIGPEIIHDLCVHGLIGDALDLYSLDLYSVEDIVEQLGEGYGERKVRMMLKGIAASKTKPFEKVLYGLAIPGVGKQNARNLAKHFGSYENLYSTVLYGTDAELMEVEGFGQVLAKSVSEFIEQAEGISPGLGERLHAIGLSTKTESEEKSKLIDSQPLAGMTVVFTGKSSIWDGDEVEETLERFGAKCTHSVSRKLSCLICGESPGPSKVRKAEEYGLRIMSEAEFVKEFLPGMVTENAAGATTDSTKVSIAADTDALF